MSVLPTIGVLLHSLDVGGAEVLVARTAAALAPAGAGPRVRFAFACLDRAGTMAEELAAAGHPVETLDRRAGLDLRCARRVREWAADRRVDLLHAHQYTPFVYAALSRLPPTRRALGGPPILFTEHGRFHPDLPSRKRAAFNRLALRRRDRVVAVGEGVKRALIDNEGLPAERIRVIYNGVDLAPYAAEPDAAAAEHRAAVRGEFGVPDDNFLAVQVARLDPIKDHATAVRAVREANRAEGRRVRLLVVGEGPERGRVEEVIRAEGAGDFVTLAGLRRDVPRLWAAADCGLLTSVSEGIPLTVIEAMAAGRPVVATDVGGLREVLGGARVESCGRLAGAGDAAALGAALREFADAPAAAATLGTVGRRRAFERFGEDRMVEAYAELYQQMAASHGRRAD
ncbi:glycosyltransferase [Alienimonas californiensis]|uniref:Glycosyltransferase EpsD n=1 Tax=Alienimonas californiensis TaxID=2527989 RepID=A0A517P448_9PLAN|nr:glycosyltransferase [Alienimonas californiensis]QDT14164.1 Putative glycosyltransferase EpsD [Alienimonas californiensis]